MQMRVFRTILGMLLLTIGLPALLVGAGLWTTMQHRDAGGAFSATLQNVATPGYAVVVDDLDSLLETDAPFVRAGDTRLRLTVRTASGPAFIGIAPAGEAARYLRGVSHAGIDGIDIGTGTLPVRSTREVGTRAPVTVPDQQGFWRASDTGQLDWNPSELRGGAWTLVVMNADAQPGIRLQTTAEVRPAWLNSAAWALLVSGTILIIVGMMVLAWPSRRREVFFVVEPSQVPELAKRIGAPLAIGSGPAGHTGTHRPRTLADANTAGTTWPRLNPPPALPQLTWPPAQTGPDTEAVPAPSDSPLPAATSTSELSAARSAGALDVKDALTNPANAGPLIGGRPLAARRRSSEQPVGERQIFEASAVEAWVAETAAARARDVDARAAAILAAEIEDDEDDTPTGTPTGAIKPVKRTAAGPAAGSATSSAPGAGAGLVPAAAGPVSAVPAGATTAACSSAASASTAASVGAVAGPSGADSAGTVPSVAAAPAAAAPARSVAPKPARSGSIMDKPFEATLTKAAVSRAGLSRTTTVFLADDDPAALDAVAPQRGPVSAGGRASTTGPASGTGPASVAGAASATGTGTSDGAVASGESASATGSAISSKASSSTGSASDAASASGGAVASTSGSPSTSGLASTSNPGAAAAAGSGDGPADRSAGEPAESTSAAAEGAAVPASRAPVGERRRSRRLTEDLAAAAEAALAGRTGATRPDVSAGSADATPSEVADTERGDAPVPVARTSGDQDKAELQAASAAGPSTGGRGRRKAAEGAESGTKSTRATRRSAQSRPQSKG
jgi:hypothetical protein